jgi:hypothetical protein
MSRHVACRLSIAIYLILLALSFLLLSTPGGKIPWLCTAAAFAIPSILAGSTRYRVMGIIGFVLAVALAVVDFQAGRKCRPQAAAASSSKRTAKSEGGGAVSRPGGSTNRSKDADATENAALVYWPALAEISALSEPDKDLIHDHKVEAVTADFIKRTDDIARWIHRGTAMPSCAWYVTGEEDPAHPLLLPYPAFRMAARFLALRSHWHAINGQSAVAVGELTDGLALARRAGTDTYLVGAVVWLASERVLIEKGALFLPKLEESAVRELATQLDRLPPQQTTAAAVRSEKRFAVDALLSKARAEVGLSELRKLLQDDLDAAYLLEDDADKEIRLAARTAIETLDREEILHKLETAITLYDEQVELYALPLAELGARQAAFTERRNRLLKDNPLCALIPAFIVTAPDMPIAFAASQAREVMFRAVVAYRLGGEAAFAKIRDPFGDGPFEFRVRPGGGFVVASKLEQKGQAVTLVIGDLPPAAAETVF